VGRMMMVNVTDGRLHQPEPGASWISLTSLADRTRSKETNGNLALQQLVRRQAIVPSALPVVDLESNNNKNYDSRDMNLNMNVSENPYYIDENYFNTLKSFHLTDVGYEDQQVSITKYVDINEGRTARLKCYTLNVPNVTVSWIRHSDLNILSLNKLVYTKDTRISIHVTPDNIEWELSISSVSTSDTGLYECQVNTNPLSQLMTKLSVTKSFTRIQGDQELFMAEKSFLNLTCIIQSVETPQGVYWRHDNQLLSSDDRGLVTVSSLTRQNNITFSISLSVWLTSTDQSGHYQCVPTNTEQAAVLVHVLDGDMLRAMYSNSNSRVQNIFSPILLCIKIILIKVCITKFIFCDERM